MGIATVLLTPIKPPLGDIDIDCAVGLADLEILLDSWGPCPDCVNCLADLDGDCAVAVPDLLRLLANWGCASWLYRISWRCWRRGGRVSSRQSHHQRLPPSP